MSFSRITFATIIVCCVVGTQTTAQGQSIGGERWRGAVEPAGFHHRPHYFCGGYSSGGGSGGRGCSRGDCGWGGNCVGHGGGGHGRCGTCGSCDCLHCLGGLAVGLVHDITHAVHWLLCHDPCNTNGHGSSCQSDCNSDCQSGYTPPAGDELYQGGTIEVVPRPHTPSFNEDPVSIMRRQARLYKQRVTQQRLHHISAGNTPDPRSNMVQSTHHQPLNRNDEPRGVIVVVSDL